MFYGIFLLKPRQLLATCGLAFVLSATSVNYAQADEAIPAEVEEIQAIAAMMMNAGPYPGMAIGIWKNGEIFFEQGFGYADLEHKIPVTPDTVFPIASITKSFTALSIMQLVDAGKISLDDPVKKYLVNYPEPGASIALRQLLNHTSGIPNYTAQPEFPRAPRRDFSQDEMLAFFKDKPLDFHPGERGRYSNSNAFLLGMIIEKVSGQSYAEYIEDHIIKPFGLTRTYYYDNNRLIAHRSHGYEQTSEGWENAIQFSATVPFSAGAIMSTVGDLLKYRFGVFQGAVTNEHVRNLITTKDKLNDGTEVFYALGCLIMGSMDGHAKMSHSGSIFGFSSFYAYYPDDDVTVVVLTNNQRASVMPVSIERKLSRVALGIKAPVIKDLTPTAKELKKYVGDYDIKPFTFGPLVYGFVARGGHLNLQYGGAGSGAPLIPLKYQGNGTFVSSADDENVFTFEGAHGTKQGLAVKFSDGRISGIRSTEQVK